ncbi:MAG TPA: PspC domain-containing protein [Verrucomicrobiae bacterium]|nr:PspC domain-containing protein [Verrucomicrobiae bacterium]
MNEVTKIHLGRQAFTISVDAHHELKNYLHAIEKQVDDKEVVEEVELRMAELLAEHGINASKVILPADVSFLKEQLGNPADFKDEDETTAPEAKPTDSKRLFRDTDNAMLAGVAAGLATYFGIDALLVRLLFVLIVFVTAGGGILLYILLWLLVPEAKTPSDRLQMAGKPVTVDSLKEIVENADVKGAANRANAALSGPINTLFRFILRLIGLVFVLSGLSILFGLVTGEAYFLSRGGTWMQGNIFPSGVRENLVLHIAAAVAALMAVFIILFGVAIFRRKWPIRTWITGVLAGLIFIGMAAGGALAADVYPTVHARYNANLHSTTRTVQPFTAVNVDNMDVNLNYQVSDKYYVALSYYDHPNLVPVKTIVQNGILILDTRQFNELRNCQTLCLPDTYNLTITVYSPNAINLENQYNVQPMPALPM